MWIIVRLLIGIIILAVVEIYFIKRTDQAVKKLFPLFHQKKFAVIKKIFLGWVNLYPVVLIYVFVRFAITSEYVSTPESGWFDYLLVYPFWLLFILMLQTALYFLLIDIIKLVLYPLFKRHKEKYLRYQAIAVLMLVIGFAVYIPIRVVYDYNTVSVRIVNYKKQNLPNALENFKIAFISDIQADHYTDKKRLDNYIGKVNSLQPDLVLIAGDFITTGPDYIDLSGKEMGTIKSKYGVYSCVGDHDNWAYRNDFKRSVAEVRSSLIKNNVLMIDNGKRIINVNGAKIGITFVTNTYVEKVPGSILDSLSSNSSGDLKIFLTHQPRENLIEAAYKNHFDLYLAGHTHGGQISLVFPFLQLTPTMIETKYIRGDFRFGNMLMIVTRGLGMSLAPVRYNSTPEITLIVLSRK
ncbi:putative metallophosphoesterase [bacterium BMS3Abin03]|nr:putative metallophosphoesterase [bacterium BMS3Abin03]